MTTEFTDGQGVVVRFRITVGQVMEIEKETGIDILDVGKWPEWIVDIRRFARVIGFMAGVDIELDGAALGGAFDAFRGAVIDFFLKAGKPAEAETVTKLDQMWQAVQQQTVETIGGIRIDRGALRNHIQSKLESSVLNCQELSGLIHDRTA